MSHTDRSTHGAPGPAYPPAPAGAGLPPLEDLIADTGSGDHAAFHRLYLATSPKMMAQALYILGRRDAAEDVLQEAFVKVWLRAKDFDPARGSAMAWLTWLLRNAAIDRLRRERMVARFQTGIEAADSLAAAQAPLDDRLDLASSLQDLPLTQMQAVIAVTLEGRTNQEAATAQAIPVPTSKARVARGLKRMRVYLRAHDNDLASSALVPQPS